MKSKFYFLFASAVIIFAAIESKPQEKGWLPLNSLDLQGTTAQVQQDADAEALFWDVHVQDSYSSTSGFRTTIDNYLRVKIFNERGREKFATVEIPFGKIAGSGVEVTVSNIAARSISPSGQIKEIQSSSVFEREVVRGRGVKIKVKSWVFEGLTPGSIVEYRWTEVRENSLSLYVRLQLSRDIPVRTLSYNLKPLSAPGFRAGMRIHSFNFEGRSFVPDKSGFYGMTLNSIRAYIDEPMMPSVFDVRPWLLVYYEVSDPNQPTELYWQSFAKSVYESHKELLKANDEVRSTVAALSLEGVELNDRVHRIYDFCVRNIRNINDDASGLSADERKSYKPNKSTADTLKRKVGTGHDINILFAAMLGVAEIEARVANVSVSNDAAFSRGEPNRHLLRTEIIAFNDGGKWSFANPARKYLPFGMIGWNEEWQAVLISDPVTSIWSRTPLSPPELSVEKRTAELRLNADGSVEGTAEISFSGHLAEYHKEMNDGLSDAQREKNLIELLRGNISDQVEVKDIRIENIFEADKPITYRFAVRIPQYVQQTRARIFLQPNIFEHNTKPVFIASTRDSDIEFPYRSQEIDHISIDLPANLVVETAESPKVVPDDTKSVLYDVQIKSEANGRKLSYSRRLSVGAPNRLRFPNTAYGYFKGLFESVQKADQAAISIVPSNSSTER